MMKAKSKLLEIQKSMGLGELQDTDLMSIINCTWNDSFVRKDKNDIAISDRGWNPLNQYILTNNDVRATTTRKEKTTGKKQLDLLTIYQIQT